jgi:hypothetical protein
MMYLVGNVINGYENVGKLGSQKEKKKKKG